MHEREAIERACAEFYEWAGALIERRRDDPGDDLISTLIEASHEGDRLDDAECMNLVLNVLVGGVDTTQSQLAHGLRVFAAHPDQWELLAERPELAPAAVEELLRYEPITPFTARLLHEDVEYRGVTFPADSIVMVCSFAGNRDGVDGDPEAFDITADRGDAKPLTFGAGHPLLPGREPRARRAAGGARLPAGAHARAGARRRGRARLDPRHLRAGSPADRMDLGLAHFLDRLRDAARRARPPGRGARLRVAAARRAHAHPGEPRHAVPGRRRAAAASTATRSTRSRRWPRSRRSTERHQDRHRRLPVIQRDPIVTAKEVATLDQLSGGRFLFGVGAGWNREEMRNHGTDPKPRFTRMRERVEAMKAIWTEDEAEYHGEHRRLRPDLVLAQAGPEAAPAGAGGRAGPEGARPRARLRRRVDPEPGEEPGGARRADRGAPAARRGGGRGASRSRSSARSPSRGCSSGLRDAGVTRSLVLPAGPASPARSSASSTSWPRWRRSGTPRRARPVAVAVEGGLRGSGSRPRSRGWPRSGSRWAGSCPATRAGSGRRSRSSSRAGTRPARAAR